MRALIAAFAVLSTGCYLAGYGSAGLDADAERERGMSSELRDASLDGSSQAPIDASQPDAIAAADAEADAHDADAEPRAADADVDAANADADAADDAEVVGEGGMDAT